MSVGLAPRPIRRAHEQVYDQLLEAMLSGRVANGERLPGEVDLAASFGVSRSTVREALRLLQNERLIRTAKGTRGGSFVTLPTIGDVSNFMRRNIELLSLTHDVTLEEFLEARRLLEVVAVRKAAAHHSEDDLDALRATLSSDEPPLNPQTQYLRNREFHLVLVDACRNSLLRIAAQPIFSVLHTHLERSALSPDFSRQVCADHRPILAAIQEGDEDAAEQLMIKHLAWLSDVYRNIWHAGSRPGTARPAAASG
jgi:GntR family transcriptional repressor for pyruvate dehydrogenase complex